MNIKFRFLWFIWFIILGVKASAQVNTNNYCPLRQYEIINDSSSIGVVAEPKPGVSFKSSNDSVFSMLDSKIVKIKKYKDAWFTVTIEASKDLQIIYYYLKDCFFKEGDYLKRGEYFATLSGFKKSYILWIIIKKNGQILSQTKHLKYIKNCTSGVNPSN
jgi:hypothetical protein